MAHGCTYCTDGFHCEKFTDEKYTSWCYGKDYPCKDRRISNADRIRDMTDEELANFVSLCCSWTCAECTVGKECNGDECFSTWLDWLKEEASE